MLEERGGVVWARFGVSWAALGSICAQLCRLDLVSVRAALGSTSSRSGLVELHFITHRCTSSPKQIRFTRFQAL